MVLSVATFPVTIMVAIVISVVFAIIIPTVVTVLISVAYTMITVPFPRTLPTNGLCWGLQFRKKAKVFTWNWFVLLQGWRYGL